MKRSAWDMTPLGAALVASLIVAGAPLTRSTSCSVTTTGTVCTETGATLFAENGPELLLVLAIPPAITLGVALVRRPAVRAGLAGLLTLLTALGALSIGMFFVPAMLLAWVVVARSFSSTASRPGNAPPP